MSLRLVLLLVFSFLKGAQPRRFRIARNVEIIRFAMRGLKLEDEGAGAGADPRCFLVSAVNRGHPGIDLAVEQTVDGAGRNAPVDHIDHTADRATAIGDRRGPAQDDDLFRIEDFGGAGVIHADAGGIDQPDAIVENAHAIAAQPANDRTSDCRSEGCR